MINQKQFIDYDAIPLAVERVNEMRAWVNRIAPYVSEAIFGARRLKSDDLDKRTRDRFEEILGGRDSAGVFKKPRHVSAHINTSYGTVYLEVRTSFPLREDRAGIKYSEITIPLKCGEGKSIATFDMHDPRKVAAGIKHYDELYQAARQAEDTADKKANDYSAFALR